MRHPPPSSLQRGFTLIESVIVIVITGILLAIVAVFITRPVQGYVDSVRRAELTDQADAALRRMARDVRLALPNSLRQVTNGFEFVLTQSGGQYRDESDGSSGAGLKYLFKDSAGFDVLGSMPTLSAGDLVVVYNLGPGYAPADAYAGGNVATVGAGVGGANPVPLSSNPFPAQSPQLRSPSARFQVVGGADKVVRYTCSGGALRRFSACTLATPSVCSGSGALLAGGSGAAAANCSFSYAPNVQGRTGLLVTDLSLSLGGETVTLQNQIHVDNSP